MASLDAEDIVITYGQVVPKPFCASTPSLIRIDGPVTLTQRAQTTGGGDYTVTFLAEGKVTVTPIDGATGLPSGPSYFANIVERHAGHLTALTQSASNHREQHELPPAGSERGSLHELLRVGTTGNDHYELEISC